MSVFVVILIFLFGVALGFIGKGIYENEKELRRLNKQIDDDLAKKGK